MMIELIIAGVFAAVSVINALGAIALWLRYADRTGIVSLIRTDEEGNVTVQYPFLSGENENGQV